MTLWDLIRDFFVTNIFGGTLSSGQSKTIGRVGQFYGSTGMNNAQSNNILVPIGSFMYSGSDVHEVNYVNIGDWLSTTFTIITLILLVLFLYIFVKWIFKLFAGLLH